MRKHLVISLLMIAGMTAVAAPKSEKTDSSQTYFKKLAEGAPLNGELAAPNMTAADLTKAIAESEKRRPAATAASEDKMSPELKAIRDRFLAVKTSDELAAMLADLDANYEKLPTDAKFLAAQIMPIQSLRGIVYKLRSVFETRSKAIHSVVLTLAKNITTNFRIYLPQESMKAVQEYFMSPYYENGSIVAVFHDEADIQALLTGPFAEQIRTAEGRIGKLDLSTPVTWDQRFSFGPETFQDGLNRYRLIGELEKSLVRAAMWSTYASLMMLRSYNIDHTIDLSASIGHLYGVDGFIGAVDGVSAAKITKAIRKYPSIGTRLPGGEKSMEDALNASRWAVVYAKGAWDASAKPRENEHLYAVDSGYWRVKRDDLQRNVDVAYRVLMSDKTEKIRSSVTGETIEINYAGFFRAASSPTNLQTLMPKTFDTKTTVTRQAITKMGTQMTAPLNYRNYAEGSPETWNTAAYQPFFPSVKSDADVFRTLRVLSHAGGSWLNIVK
jgi:hypothetical protein